MRYSLFLLALLLSPLYLAAQVQIGSDIDGIDPNHDFGCGLSINAVGDVIAIGSPRWEEGVVYVYRRVDNRWQQMGASIDALFDRQWFGYSSALSGDGERLVVGSYNKNHLLIFEWQSGEWQTIGTLQLGTLHGAIHYGHAVDISVDGKIVAASATHHPQGTIHTGIVTIYREEAGEWIQMGAGIPGDHEKDQSGWSIALSDDGYTIAIGSISESTNGEDAGQVRVFRYENGNWQQMGDALYGKGAHYTFGRSVDLSSDGKTLAVGAPGGWTGMDPCYASVYTFENNAWQPKGPGLDGRLQEYFGYQVALSGDGNRLSVSAPPNVDCPVRVYDFIDGRWRQAGEAITSMRQYNNIGSRLAINREGNILATASTASTEFVAVYDISALAVHESPDCMFDVVIEPEAENPPPCRLFPNPTVGRLTVENAVSGNTITAVNILGQQLNLAFNSGQTLDLSPYPAGVYYLYIDGAYCTVVKADR